MPLCRCGCGTEIGYYKKTWLVKGYIKGQPKQFANGHAQRIVASQISTEDLFLSRLDKTESCWNYTGPLISKGYGAIHRGNKCILYAHRFSYEYFIGPIPKGMMVLHRCDNPKCVNPSHLFLGTNKDNVQDMISKKRHSHGPKHGIAVSIGKRRANTKR